MNSTVVLNAAKLDFDKHLDFSPIRKITSLTSYDTSSDADILERVNGQHVVITKELPLGRNLIEQFPASVKLICEAGTGYNNIDLAAAKEKNITVCNVPGYSTEAVAQLAIGFMLNLSSSLSLQQTMIKRQNYANFTQHLQVPHFELQNKTLGVIGSGAIGRQVMVVARALGMKILTYSRTQKNWDDPAIRAVTLEELLRNSDFVTIHCPLTSETKHLINKDTIKLMKPSAFLINTSRGPIIKESDLIDALKNKQLAGAALDVQDPEPPELTNPLFGMDNVLLTPHIGWKTLESRQRLIGLLATNIESYFNGHPVNVVS